MSLLLAIDGALGAFSAAVVERDNGTARGWRAETAAGSDALERGLALVQNLLGERSLVDVSAIAVTTGPGTFTGLRIAISYAKSLAFARDVPLIGVSSYDVVETEEDVSPRVALVSGRSGLVCARLTLDRTGESSISCGSYEAVAASLAARLPPASTLFAAGAVEGVVSQLGERGLIVRPSPPMEMPPALALAHKALQRAPAPSPHAIRADYGSVDYYTRARLES